jgi:putative tryptophan/tyrosine transport system substrate-binding protein
MQYGQLKRREFITLLGGAATWPRAASAQQPDRMHRIAVLMSGAEDDSETQARIKGFRQGLEALGWAEGRNIQIDYRFAAGDANRIQMHVAELMTPVPELIVANSSPVVSALKQATRTIPIVFTVVNDPVGQGFVASLAHPAGNITGFSFMDFALIGKWLELLKEIAPGVRRATLLYNPATAPYFADFLRELVLISPKVATEMTATLVQDQAAVEAAVAVTAREPGGALIAAADPFVVTNRALIISLAERYHMPALYSVRQSAKEGGLMSYGPDTADIFRRSASYVDRILKGAKPADLPVQMPTKYELVINLKTAKALGLTVPLIMQMTAEITVLLLHCMGPFMAVRPEGANHQWRKNPPGELSIDPVADERLVRVTAWVGAS